MSADKRVLFVLGGPGAGKGTQCERLQELGWTVFSAGDLLRAAAKRDDDEGRRIAAIMMEGKIVPASIGVSLCKREMLAAPSEVVAVDGFPRSEEQLAEWERQVGAPTAVLQYDVAEPVMLERLLSRARTSGRADDNEETIRKRFAVYVETTMPVVRALEARGLVAHVDGSEEPDAVFAATLAALRRFGLA